MQAQLGLAEGFWRFDQLKQALSGHLGKTTDIVSGLLAQATASSLALLGWLGNLLLIPVVAFYLLRDWDLMLAKLQNLLPRAREGLVVRLVGECHEVLGAFMRGQLLVMLALAGIYSVGLMVVGLELGLLIGLLAGLASIVPYMGFIVGFGAAVVAALFQYSGFELYPLIGIAVVFGIGQLLEGMLLTPYLTSRAARMNAVAVFVGLLFWGWIWEVWGVLLAVPMLMMIKAVCDHVEDFRNVGELLGE